MSKDYSDNEVQKVWEKGYEISGLDRKVWQEDSMGNKIKRDEYGNRDSDYGWEIDHIHPKSKGGGDELSNLQPLQWEANMKKSDEIDWKNALL